jgi:putative ABC transport system permease protein
MRIADTVHACASGVFSGALRVCPWKRLRKYHDDMRETFAARCDAAASRGSAAVIALLVRELADICVAPLARTRVGFVTNRSTVADRSVQRRSAVSSLIQDVRYALRMLYRQPGFAFVAIVTLALGIGATTAVFTVVNGLLVRPLPYSDPARLVILLNGRNGRLVASFSPPNYRDAGASGVFEDAAAFTNTTLNLTGNGDPERLEGVDVTWSFFSVLGATPRLGRAFVEADAQSGANVIVIGDGLWRRLGGRHDIVGSALQLDGRPYTVIGVSHPDAAFPTQAAYWRPLVFTPQQISDGQRGAQWVNAIARLKRGVTMEQANAALAVVGRRLGDAFPRANRGRQLAVAGLKDRMVRDIRPALLVLFGAVTLVLLIACVNVANLLLARAQSRTREVVVRAAVGASRWRLVRQFLVESLVLGGAGGLAGLLLAAWSTRALLAFGMSGIPRLEDVAIDWRVLLFAIGLATATSVFFGLIPAFAVTSLTGRTAANSGRGTIGPGGTRARRALVVCELALAVILLVGAGLLLRSYDRIRRVDPGFTADGVLTFRVALPEAKYKEGAAVSRFIAEYMHRLAHTSGVRNATAVFGLPLDDEFDAFSTFTRAGEIDTEDSPNAGMRVITPDYLRTLNIPLRAGRMFDDRDTGTSPEVVLINEEAAHRFWPDRNPLGQQLHLGARLTSSARSGQKTIVGIVGNVKYGALDAATPPEIYLPHQQHPVPEITIAIRTLGDPMAFVAVARAELSAIDRELPISAIRPLTEVVRRSVAERRFLMLLLIAFATVAVLLAAIGVYGVLAYLVSQRTQEIGVRLALGASPRDVVRLFVREGVMLACIGLGAGLVGALAAGRTLSAMLFGIGPHDPVTFVGVAATLAASAVCASYLPAKRAARVEPMQALRAE